jgi:adenine/guanine/hypoxanthine permease
MENNGTGSGNFKYKWFVIGDINGFFGLMFDNLTALFFMTAILVFGFGFPADIIYTRMFPGTALGVFVGDLVYTWMAFKLAKKTKNPKVTAMPLGLDTPSTIGIALAVLGPAFVGLKQTGMSVTDAAMMTWYIGMATMVLMGIVKVIFSFIGPWIQKVVPQAGLLGSLAGIGIVLLGFLPMVEVFGMPVIGMVALGLVLYTTVAKINLPKNIPGIFSAIVLGTILYYILGPLGLTGGKFAAPSLTLHFGLPIPTLDFLKGFGAALKYLPVAIPFALLTVVGGINVTESARVAGDDFDTQQILLTEAIATLIAGVCGGVAQSTPYIGQPAYKHMGCRAGYTILTALFIGLGGVFGYVGFIVELIPKAVISPILIFVALEITSQAFIACPKKHAPAVALSLIPIISRLLQIKFTNPEFIPIDKFNHLMVATTKALPEMLVTIALGNGFILTAMLWGALLAEVISRRLKIASVYCFICGIFSFFGVIHSAFPNGNMYWPWKIAYPYNQVPYQFTAGYVVLGIMFLLFSFSKEVKKPYVESY